ncbi:hypothetical protein B0I35DRAFT_483100 [Stachybotrys elegans]|uniref:F-box domain-containing protein n=1 Tax=Stachybotrys elegans TaxID=80388 RepID=A0A8K0SM48_9HYPO|nr:hypothetical protein B0I35DRAFT_483100 [Stachybotrys elegans]
MEISPIECLPPELLRMVLTNLDSLTTLRCAILSSRVLLRSFNADSSAIATRVLFNQLDARNVRPEAIAAVLALDLARPTRRQAEEFLSAHILHRNAEHGIRLTPNQATYLLQLHSAISRLTEDFITATFQHLITAAKECRVDQAQALTPSALERDRITRTFYIIEIFFNVFRTTSMSDMEEGLAMYHFLVGFARWEVEQITCVQEFLFFHVSPSFNEMAAHDVGWGKYEVPPVQWFGAPQIHSVYFKGLAVLDSLARAKTYDAQFKLFDHGQIPRGRDHNLFRALKGFKDMEGGRGRATVSQYNMEDYGISPHFDDPDGGPFSIWKWAHEGFPLHSAVYNRHRSRLRRWGYVMLDQARLKTLALCEERYQLREARPFRWSPPDFPPREDDDESWELSYRERARIYDEHGRGWWSAGDESKIVWRQAKEGPAKSPAKKSPAKAHIIPTSLEEARRIILALQWP